MSTESHKVIIGSLLNKCEDNLTKKVLSVYSPTVTYKTNFSNIKKFDAAHLESAAAFLGFKVRDDDENRKLYKNLTILSDRIILKIESLFETKCSECNEQYTNKLSDTPTLVCHLCLQGSHGCDGATQKASILEKMMEESQMLSGSIWLCSGCYDKNNLEIAPKGSLKSNLEQIPEETRDVTDHGHDNNDTDRESPRRGRDSVTEPTKNSEAEPTKKSKEDSTAPDTVCGAYKKRQCPHGPTGKFLIEGKACPFPHPPRCFRFCNHGKDQKLGCNRGKDCRYWHPRLCKFSVRNRTCSKEDCTFYHLKGTKRPHKVRSSNEREPDVKKDVKKDTTKHTDEFATTRPKRMMKFDSMASLNSVYPPTIARKRKDSELKNETSFLLQVMDNMKEGIISQMADRFTELQAAIPSLVWEQVNMNRPAPQLPVPAHMPHASQVHMAHASQAQMPQASQAPQQLLNHQINYAQNPMFPPFQVCSY